MTMPLLALNDIPHAAGVAHAPPGSGVTIVIYPSSKGHWTGLGLLNMLDKELKRVTAPWPLSKDHEVVAGGIGW